MNLTTTIQEEFSQETIENISYENECIQNKTFDECVFKKCNLISCQLKNCTFLHCTFEECVLSATSPINSRFIEPSFVHSKSIGVDWTSVKELRDLSFQDSSLDYSNFRYLDIQNIRILNSTAIEADFAEAKMKKLI